ncbi:hypothetical protein AMTRI_Chr02g257860 [Amborella trichopoda]
MSCSGLLLQTLLFLFLSPSIAAAGASYYLGVRILDINGGLGIKTLNWDHPIDSSVQAIGVFDRASFTPFINLGHEERRGGGGGGLNWVSSQSLLMASCSYSGPLGCLRSIKLWDIRSDSKVSEIKEKANCCVMSGNGKREDVNHKTDGNGNNVFSSRVENVEEVFRKNVMGSREKVGLSRITHLDFGVNLMVLARKDEQAIEVWQGSGTKLCELGWESGCSYY